MSTETPSDKYRRLRRDKKLSWTIWVYSFDQVQNLSKEMIEYQIGQLKNFSRLKQITDVVRQYIDKDDFNYDIITALQTCLWHFFRIYIHPTRRGLVRANPEEYQKTLIKKWLKIMDDDSHFDHFWLQRGNTAEQRPAPSSSGDTFHKRQYR